MRGKKRRTRGKTSRSRVENQHTQSTYEGGSEFSHRLANTAAVNLLMLELHSNVKGSVFHHQAEYGSNSVCGKSLPND